MIEFAKCVLCIVVLFIVIGGLTPILANAIDTDVCAALDERLPYDEKLEWIGYPDGWDLPDDLQPIGLFPLVPLGDIESNAHYGQYVSLSEQALYTFYFENLRADGEPYGQHHICPQVWKKDF